MKNKSVNLEGNYVCTLLSLQVLYSLRNLQVKGSRSNGNQMMDVLARGIVRLNRANVGNYSQVVR